MPIHQLRLDMVVSRLENATLLAAPLFHEEVSAYEAMLPAVRRHVQDAVCDVLETLPLLEHHRRHAAGSPLVRELTLELQPPSKRPTWLGPVTLRFHAVCWEHGNAAAKAC